MNKLIIGDNRQVMRRLIDDGVKVQSCITSPPYFGLRDYGHAGQIGLEPTLDEYIENLVDVFGHVRELLTDDGTLWLNIGDSYAGSGKGRDGNQEFNPNSLHGKQATSQGSIQGKIPKQSSGLAQKNLIGVPWRVALALQADGWYLRQEIIWHKTNAMPGSYKDRFTSAHESIFLLTKNPDYYFDQEAVKEPSVCQGSERTSRDDFKRDDSKRGQVIPHQGAASHRPDRPVSGEARRGADASVRLGGRKGGACGDGGGRPLCARRPRGEALG